MFRIVFGDLSGHPVGLDLSNLADHGSLLGALVTFQFAARGHDNNFADFGGSLEEVYAKAAHDTNCRDYGADGQCY